MSDTKTYRGDSLEELLPQIRAELGEDAVVTRRREGVVGGFGGFFGKRCVEVEARAAAEAQGALLDAYDDGGDDPLDNPLMETVMRQSAPFAERLEAAELDLALPARGAPAPVAASATGGEVVVESRLLRAGLDEKLVRSLLADVERDVLPFFGGSGLREHVRAALAERIQVKAGWRSKRRRIALVGTPGAGRTLAAARLAGVYARAGRSVAALSLEEPRAAFELGQLTEADGVHLDVAAAPGDVAGALARLKRFELVVVDAPAFVPGDAAATAELSALLAAVSPDETHLVVPGATSCESATRLLAGLADAGIAVDRLLPTRLDERRDAAGLVGASLAAKLPFSYLADAGLRPADAATLAELVL